jgi:hypothetical protein
VLDVHEPHGLELLERLAQRWRADAEVARHLADGRQPVARLEFAALDERLDPLRQIVGEALPRKGLEHTFHGELGRCEDARSASHPMTC